MDIYVQKDGQRHGPFPEARIRQGIDAGEFGADDLAWMKGKASWQPLSALIRLNNDQPPPLQIAEDLQRTEREMIHADIIQPMTGLEINVIYAGFWIRVAALIVDTLVLLIPSLIVTSLFQGTNSASTTDEQAIRDSIGSFINFMMWVVYCAAFESSSWQATIGKKVAGLKVIDVDGRRISFARGFARNIGMMISAFIFCIGFVTMGFTKRRQGIHDLLTRTCVVKARSLSRFA